MPITMTCPNCNKDFRLHYERKEHKSKDTRREVLMAADFLNGMTLNQIGMKNNISRERVRQILDRIGISASDGGNKVIVKKRAEAKKRYCIICRTNECKLKYCDSCRKKVMNEKAKIRNQKSKLKKQLEASQVMTEAVIEASASLKEK